MYRIHEVHTIERETSKGTNVVGSDLQKFKQLPDLILRGLKKFPACRKQLRKRKSMNGLSEKPKLDNARRLRGIDFVDPEDGE